MFSEEAGVNLAALAVGNSSTLCQKVPLYSTFFHHLTCDMIYSARNKSKGYDSEWVVALALYSVIEMVSILEVMTPADWKDDYMNERCFALKSGNQSNGICICMASERCHGYSSCSFYKPMWKYERDEKRKFARLRSLPVEQQHTISEMYYNGNMPWADKSV